VLRAGHGDYVINSEALVYMRQRALRRFRWHCAGQAKQGERVHIVAPTAQAREPECLLRDHSTVALRCSLSSGLLASLRLAPMLGPEAIATYCLPLTSKVMGGAEKPEPTLTFHNSSSVDSSKAAMVPSSRANPRCSGGG
jgi:hypothetical protein